MKILQLVLLMCLSTIIVASDVSREWVYPPNCNPGYPCLYNATWVTDEVKVTFTIVAKQSDKTWIGIGFAKEKKVEEVEFIYAYFGSKQQEIVIDGWIPSRHSAPLKDPVQNLVDMSISYKGGYLTLVFSHPRVSYGIQEYNFTDGESYYLVAPVGGGKSGSDDGLIDKLEEMPKFSDAKICFRHEKVILGESTISLSSLVTPAESLVSESIGMKSSELFTALVEETMTTENPRNIEELTVTSEVLTERTHLVTGEVVPTHVMPESTMLEDFTKSTISHETKLWDIITTKKPADIKKEYKIISYYWNLSQHRPEKVKLEPEDIDPLLSTHLIFAFACLYGNRLVPCEQNDPIPNGLYERFNKLKENSNVKTLLAVGGLEAGTANMTIMLKTKESRDEFIKSCIELLRKHKFDGLDLHFQYPGSGESPSEDKQHFTCLIVELRKAFEEEAKNTGKTPLILSAAVPAKKDIIDNGYEVPKISPHLDFINLMAYDFYNGSEPMTGHHAPLFPGANLSTTDAQKNLEWAAKYWVDQGAPREKLIIGLAAFGRGFILQDPNQHLIGAPTAGPSPPGPYTQQLGFLSYYEVCEHIADYKFTKVWLKDEKVPFIYNETLWFGYDDPDSLKIKVDWVKDKDYGGVMIWSMDLDDFKGEFCNMGHYPLLRALHTTLMGNTTTTPTMFSKIPSNTETMLYNTETTPPEHHLTSLPGA